MVDSIRYNIQTFVNGKEKSSHEIHLQHNTGICLWQQLSFDNLEICSLGRDSILKTYKS